MGRFFPNAAVALSLTALLGALPASASAQAVSFPAKPIQIVVPYPPGGSNDVFARALAQRLGSALKQSVVVENRAGGGGSIGANYVANSAPDGYTLVYVSSSFVTSAASQKLPFDPIKSFAPVAVVGKGPMVIVVNNKSPIKTLADLIALAKREPGKLNYATSGLGSVNQFATELFASMTGIKLTHIPYKGMGPAVNDLIGGQVDLIFGSIPSVMQFARSGMIHALAITSDGQSPLEPALPAINANGVPGYVVVTWSGVLAPAGTPPAVVAKLNSEINRILELPEMHEFLQREGIIESPSSPADFAKLIATDLTLWKKLANDVGIHAD
jgi:tripartite-type tricarboxylate transporter receptor subunit TctC